MIQASRLDFPVKIKLEVWTCDYAYLPWFSPLFYHCSKSFSLHLFTGFVSQLMLLQILLFQVCKRKIQNKLILILYSKAAQHFWLSVQLLKSRTISLGSGILPSFLFSRYPPNAFSRNWLDLFRIYWMLYHFDQRLGAAAHSMHTPNAGRNFNFNTFRARKLKKCKKEQICIKIKQNKTGLQTVSRPVEQVHYQDFW